MCAWWMYKNNSLNRSHQAAWGDWRELFDRGKADSWGRVEWTPDLARLQPGDGVLAYQTNRNELVGVAEVVGLRRSKHTESLWLKPIEPLGVKLLPLKRSDPAIAAIPALKQGPVRTIYEMTVSDAERLLEAARAVVRERVTTFREGTPRTTQGVVRSRALRDEAKRFWGCRCFCCDFDFEQFYGAIAHDVAVVHHLETFDKTRDGARRTSVLDVRVVCDNCHRVLHLSKPPMGVGDLRKRVALRRGKSAAGERSRRGRMSSDTS